MTHLLPLMAMLLSSEAPAAPPLPNAMELRQRTLRNMRASAQALERYACSVATTTQRLDGDGRLKDTDTRRSERFFVNGVQIDHVLEKNGKPLTGGAKEKEQRRTDREVRKYSEAKRSQKVEDEREKRLEMFLRAQRLVDGRRNVRDGRRTLSYRLEPDPSFHPRNLEERFSQAAAGRIWIDEESGAPVELQISTSRDVKMGGGLLANLHKGFQLHLTLARQPDGVWLTRMVEGNADLRAGLFLHPRVHFTEETSSCRLYSVHAEDTVHGSENLRP